MIHSVALELSRMTSINREFISKEQQLKSCLQDFASNRFVVNLIDDWCPLLTISQNFYLLFCSMQNHPWKSIRAVWIDRSLYSITILQMKTVLEWSILEEQRKYHLVWKTCLDMDNWQIFLVVWRCPFVIFNNWLAFMYCSVLRTICRHLCLSASFLALKVTNASDRMDFIVDFWMIALISRYAMWNTPES